MSNYPVSAFPIAGALMKQNLVLSCGGFHLRRQKHMVFQQASNSPDCPQLAGERLRLQIHSYGNALSGWGSVSWAKENDCKKVQAQEIHKDCQVHHSDGRAVFSTLTKSSFWHSELVFWGGRHMVPVYRQRVDNLTIGHHSCLYTRL